MGTASISRNPGRGNSTCTGEVHSSPSGQGYSGTKPAKEARRNNEGTWTERERVQANELSRRWTPRMIFRVHANGRARRAH